MSRLRLVVPYSLVHCRPIPDGARSSVLSAVSRALVEAACVCGAWQELLGGYEGCYCVVRESVSIVCPAQRHHRVASYPAASVHGPGIRNPWESVSMDLFSLPHNTHGNSHLLFCVDRFSRLIVVSPIPDKSAPLEILNDNGVGFNNAVLEAMCPMSSIYSLICRSTGKTPHRVISDM